MKSLSHFLACVGALSLLSVGCERHEFEKTKILHQEHGGEHHEGESHKGDHKEDHAGDDKSHAGDKDHAKGDEKGKEEEKPEKEEGRDVGI